MEKKCILCGELFEPKKSYYGVCAECLFYKNMTAKKKMEKWLPGKKEWDFIRENNEIMSPDEMADYFKITLGELTREKGEMGLTIDEEGSSREYELHRFLNRFERANTWEIRNELDYVANFLHKKRIYDTSEILGRKFT